MSGQDETRHFGPVSLSTRDGIALIAIDNPPLNTLSAGVRKGLAAARAAFARETELKAAVVHCRGATFVCGADIRELGAPLTPPRYDEVFAQVEDLTRPVVAAVHGTALGGGLELALAAHGRIATREAVLGLPEVRLGLMPGAGGTQRLPRLVGAARALDWMLSGEPVSAATALETGLIDRIAGGDLLTEAIAFARELAAQGFTRTRDRAVGGAPPGGAEELMRTAEQRARGQTAPVRIARAVVAALEGPAVRGFATELELFGACLADPQSRALRHLFFAERATGRVEVGTARDIASVAIIGAGTMGSGIASACLDGGLETTLIDVDAAGLERGLARVRDTLAAQVKKGRVTQAQANERASRLKGGASLEAAAAADLVVEAVFENIELKGRVFADLDRIAKPGAVLATNTSYLDVLTIGRATQRPASVLGLHFFSPANVMKLLEVVNTGDTAADTLATGLRFARRIGKIPVVAGNAPGFIGNRMLQAYGRESQLLLLEGASPQQVDRALERFGMAMGPCAVFDLAGIDVGYKARRERKDLPKDPRYFRIADALAERGWLGQKSAHGHYRYPAGSRTREPDAETDALIAAEAARLGIARTTVADETIVARCISALILEGSRLLDEGIARRPLDIDVVWVNGYGFPRWRGGPMQYADEQGLAQVQATVAGFAKLPGLPYWAPSTTLERLVRERAPFASLNR